MNSSIIKMLFDFGLTLNKDDLINMELCDYAWECIQNKIIECIKKTEKEQELIYRIENTTDVSFKRGFYDQIFIDKSNKITEDLMIYDHIRDLITGLTNE